MSCQIATLTDAASSPFSNDDYFDPRAQILKLTAEQAVQYAKDFIDRNCEKSDAAYLSEVVTAGERSPEVTYRHAIGGSPIAQLVYGTAKLKGLHTDQNVSEGLFWLIRSFNNRNPRAGIVLAGTYIEGEHIAKNLKRALKYASFAADQGLPAGQFVLANLLISAGEIPIDQERAVELLQAAAKSGYAPAQRMLDHNNIPLE